MKKGPGRHAGNAVLCTRFHHASELIGRRWTGAIIFLLLDQPHRFAALRDAIPDITDRMLCDRLRELEEEGIVERTVVPETPVRVEYALTRKGMGLAEAVRAITEWAHRWIEIEPPAEQSNHRANRAQSQLNHGAHRRHRAKNL